MKFEDVYVVLNQAVLDREGRPLTKAEQFVLTGAWNDATYETIAEQSHEYSINYLKRDVGPKLWKLLSGVFHLEVNKKNFRDVVQRIVSKKHSDTPLISALKPPVSQTIVASPDRYSAPSEAPNQPRYDLGEAVNVDLFFGRDQELNKLEQWIADSDHRCRIVSLLGVAGIGKTSLAVKLVERVKSKFKFVIWRSLKQAPTLTALLADLIDVLSGKTAKLNEDSEASIAELMDYLRQYPCLLVLDDVEAILSPQRSAGRYRQGYEQYGELIKYIGEEAHQSCLLLVGREKLNEVALMEGVKLFVKSRKLSGLSVEDAQKIVDVKGFQIFEAADSAEERFPGSAIESADSESISVLEHIQAWNQLIEHYGGNPLAIKLASTAVYELFNGDVIAFLCQSRNAAVSSEHNQFPYQGKTIHSKTIFDSIYDLIEEQINRLPKDERTILNWLALSYAPVSYVELQNAILSPEVRRKFLGLLKSLKDRSLIEVEPPGFTLQPVIREFLIEKLIEQLLDNLNNIDLVIAADQEPELNQYALIQARAEDDAIERQILAIIQPMLDRLLTDYGSQEAVEQQLKFVLQRLQAVPALKIGYAAGNVINLLRRLKQATPDRGFSALEGYNFANLDLRQACLQNTSLRRVNCRNAELSTAVFTEPIADILSVCCDAKAQWFAVGDMEGKIHVWKFVPHSKLVVKYRSWQGHDSWVRTVAFDPKSQMLVSGSNDRTVKLWDVHTGQCLRTLSSKDWVRTAQFSPDGRLFAIGSDDYSVQLWSVSLDDQPFTLTNDSHLDRVRTVAFSPNGKLLASSGDDQTIILWDVAQRRSIQRLEGHTDRVRSLSFSPDSQWLASGSDDRTVLLWKLDHLTTGQISEPEFVSESELKPEQKYTEHTDRVRAVIFSPDGKLLVSGGDDCTIWIRDRQQKSTLRLGGDSPKRMGRVQSLAFKPNSRILISGHDNQILKLWNLSRSGSVNVPVKKLQGFTNGIQALKFTAPNLLISGCDDHRIQIWDINQSNPPTQLVGHTGRITTLALGQYGPNHLPVLASGSDDCTVKLWDLRSGHCLQTFSYTTHWIRTVAFNWTGKILAIAGDDQCIHLWDIDRPTIAPRTLRGHKHWIRSIAFSPNPDIPLLASGGDDQVVMVWNAHTGEWLRSLDKHQHRIRSVVFSPDGTLLASGSDAAVIKIWDVQRGEDIQILQTDSDDGDNACGIKSIAFSPDGSLLACGNEAGIVRLWDLATWEYQILADVNLGNRSHQRGVHAVTFSPDGQTIASSDRDGEIKLWQVATGAWQRTLKTDRLCTDMDITGARGLSDVQRATLLELGAVDRAP
ncbi:WD40 domain-containing protein [Egbenema bharatensis]|uniref:WD40 domain-containing protein n=1 Tax=Egbenema bharatensis TaxID=3463334 RepID=UPI003A8AEA87